MSAGALASPVQAMETLIMAVRELASDDSYKKIASMFDEVQLLKQQIASKDNELHQLKANLQTNLELYRTTHNKLVDEKAALSKNISALGTTLQEKRGQNSGSQ